MIVLSHKGRKRRVFDLPVSLRVRGSVDKIFTAWTSSAVAKEWLCDRMEGEWKPGSSVFWHHGEYRQEIRIVEVEPLKRLAFRWRAYGEQPETNVEIQFKQLGGEVGVLIREREWALTVPNVNFALDHACGWENTLCRLKAWIEAGVKLR